MPRRPSDFALMCLALLAAAFALTFADAAAMRGRREGAAAERCLLVERAGLTDLCLFTEARYTRHPSQADLFSAFQDYPLAVDHFPTGSLRSPPAALVAPHAHMDRETALSH